MASMPQPVAVEPDLFAGLRMSADEFLRLPDDGQFYELIDGVVQVSPSPTPEHQAAMIEITGQLFKYLEARPLGRVFAELDVHLGQGPGGGDLVYRPEVIFVSADRVRKMRKRIVGAPELVVEVISQGSRRLDSQTKKQDYERCGVVEYWLVDPARESIRFYRRKGRKFAEVRVSGDTFKSMAVPGFVLDVARVRDTFKPW